MQNIYKMWQLFGKKTKVNFVLLFKFVLLRIFYENSLIKEANNV